MPYEIPELIELKNTLDDPGELEQHLLEIGVKENERILTVTGCTKTYEIAREILESSELELIFKKVKKPTPAAAVDLVELIQVKDASHVLAIGGGKPIDVAKYAAHTTGKPLYVLPTAPSHDGISSGNVSLKGWGKPYSIVATPPRFVFYDLQLLVEAPYDLITAGIGDMLGKFTASRDLDLSIQEQRYNLQNFSPEELKEIKTKYFIDGAKKIFYEINKLKQKGFPEASFRELVGELFHALFNSGKGMAKLKSSVGASGSEHLYAHALPRGRHGHKVAIGSIIMMYMQEKYLGEEKIYGVDHTTLREKFEFMGIPTTGEALGVKEEEMIYALLKAKEIGRERGRFTILECVEITPEYGKKLLTKLEII